MAQDGRVMTRYFDRFEISMTKAEAGAMSHQGPCDDDVDAHLSLPKFVRQFRKINPEDIRAELKGYGAWDKEELADDAQNQARILWIAAGDIKEGNI